MSMLKNIKKFLQADKKQRSKKKRDKAEPDWRKDIICLNAEYIKYRALHSNASSDDVLGR